jgi:hypothetical protein
MKEGETPAEKEGAGVIGLQCSECTKDVPAKRPHLEKPPGISLANLGNMGKG